MIDLKDTKKYWSAPSVRGGQLQSAGGGQFDLRVHPKADVINIKSRVLQIFVPIAFALFLSFWTPDHSFAQGWYNTGGTWVYRTTITVNSGQVPSTQTNFPVLVNLSSDAGLASHARSDGFDILFTSGNGTTKIPYQREKFTKSTGELVAWVNVPSVSVGTVIYMYYGNSCAADQQGAAITVWDANYIAIWHMNEATGAIQHSATQYTYYETANSSPVQTPSKIDGGLNFNGSTQFTFGYSTGDRPEAFCEDRGAITYSFWAKMPTGGGGYVMGVGCAGGQGYGGVVAGLNYLDFGWTPTDDGHDDAIYGSGFTITAGQWAYCVVALDIANRVRHFYVNGAEVLTSFYFTSSDWYPVTSYNSGYYDYIGGRYVNSNNYFNGTLDEVRISSNVRSANWVATEYNNQNSPGTFYSLGVEQCSETAGTITGTATVCQGQNGVAYSIPPIPNATGYVWTLPSGATIATGTNTNSITVNFGVTAVSGNITVYGIDACGDKGTVSPNYAVTVNPLPGAAGTITGTAIVCHGSTGVTYTVPAIANATGYVWTLPAGASITAGSNTNSITVSFSNTAISGNITVYGTNACGNGTASPNYAVTVNPLPSTSAIYHR